VTPDQAADRLRENTVVWEGVLAGPAAGVGPVGSRPVDRAGRVRDLHLALLGRPAGPAVRDPAEVAADLALAADEVVERVLGVGAGAAGGVEALLAEVESQAWACRREVTVAAYDAAAEAYRDASGDLADTERAAVAELVARLGPGARVLEIGTGGGRDALALEAAGASVRRTDVAPAFVRLLREAGHEAEVLDPLGDDLTDPAPAREGLLHDAVWANASLLHVARTDLPTVLLRLAAVTRAGGLLRASVKEGDGEAWSTHGALDLPRTFTYWREGSFVAALSAAGWRPERLERAESMRGEHWLVVTAVRDDGRGSATARDDDGEEMGA